MQKQLRSRKDNVLEQVEQSKTRNQHVSTAPLSEALMDEIDRLLEENELKVEEYRQKGGQ